MTIDVTALRARLRVAADDAATNSRKFADRGDDKEAQFYAGRQAGVLTALNFLDLAEQAACVERDEAFGEGVNLAAVERLAAFGRGEDVYGDYATETGALDQASGTVYSDADGGL